MQFRGGSETYVVKHVGRIVFNVEGGGSGVRVRKKAAGGGERVC